LSYDFKAAGKKMEYGLFVPSSYTLEVKSKTRFPLIVALHGLGSNPQQILSYPGLVTLAEKHGYIVVAPMGYNSSGWYGVRGQRSRSWKPTNLGELSEQDVMNVLELTEKAYRVDPKRVYLMGHSMGGGGTLHLGMKYPKRWAALAPIAPAIYRSPRGLIAIREIPVIVVQGAKDRLVRASSTRRWIQQMKELEMTHKYIEYKDGGHISPAFQGLPAIFEFFNTHSERGAKVKEETQKKAKATKKETKAKQADSAASPRHPGLRVPAPPGTG
jgi:poly(3-hydroxybutyrate) depolymerase